jgi:alpha-glucoside transport system substrate-binding protein
MPRHRTRRVRALLGLATSLLVLGAACAKDDNNDKATGSASGNSSKGKVVTIFGPEVEGEAQGLLDAFKGFEKDTGIDVQVQGDRSFEQQIGVRVDGGNPPDIAMFPQPGKIKDFAADLKPLPTDIVSDMKDNFDPGFVGYATVNGKVYAVPAKADLKSLVWYSPKAFTDGGYEIPKTFDAFLALSDKMIKDGKTPFCIGLGSDAATGWPFTDWVEDFMLRLKGPDTYDKWVNHTIPFNSTDVVDVGNAVYKLWSTKGAVFGGLQNVAATPFADAGLPLLKGDCMMHRQGNFYAANWPKGTKLGEDGEVNAFYLPGSTANPNVTLTGGIFAAAFADRPEVMKTMKFIASKDFADARAPVGGFLSPNKNTDTSKYPTAIERNFAEILAKAAPVRFDASDLMPGAVGSGTFWTAAVDITTGAKDVKTAFTAVEGSWPKS